MKKSYGVCLGILAFGIVSALVGVAFQKPPEQIAREDCAKLQGTASAFGINPSTTVYVEGVAYKCN